MTKKGLFCSLPIWLFMLLLAAQVIPVATAAAVLNLEESFEGTTFPPTGWTSQNVLGDKVWGSSPYKAYAGTASAFIDYQTTGGEDWLITPQLTSITTDSTLNFWWHNRYSDGPYPPDNLTILVSTTDTALTSFIGTLGNINTANAPFAWTHHTYSLSDYDGLSFYIAFKHTNTDGMGGLLDNVTVITPSSTTTTADTTTTTTAVTTTTTAAPATTTTTAQACVDADADGYGDNCAAGPDCDDDDSAVHDTCTACTVRVIPRNIGWLIGEREATRRLLVIGGKGADYDENTPVSWDSEAIDILNMRVFFKRFILLKVRINGEQIGKGDYTVTVDNCSGTVGMVR